MALSRKRLMLFKIESTYNTNSSPDTSNDAIAVINPEWKFEGANIIERDVLKSTLGKSKAIYAGAMMQVTCDVEIKGSGALGVAPEFGPLLRACGNGETIVASTSVSYSPVTSGHESGTLVFYDDGIIITLTGVRGNWSPKWEKIGVISFTLTGHIESISDGAFPSATFDTTVPPPVIGAPFTVGGFSSGISSFSFDAGNAVIFPTDVRSSDGYGEVVITGRDVAGSFDPPATNAATNDFIGDFRSSADMAVVLGPIGGTAGNRHQLNMSSIHYRDLSPGDRDGLRSYALGIVTGKHHDQL